MLTDHATGHQLQQALKTASLNELAAELGYLKDRISTLTHERACLPRNDKDNARRLLDEINRLQRETRTVKHFLANAQAKEQKHKRHSLWCSAVAALFGADAPQKCFEWMQQQRAGVEG